MLGKDEEEPVVGEADSDYRIASCVRRFVRHVVSHVPQAASTRLWISFQHAENCSDVERYSEHVSPIKTLIQSLFFFVCLPFRAIITGPIHDRGCDLTSDIIQKR